MIEQTGKKQTPKCKKITIYLLNTNVQNRPRTQTMQPLRNRLATLAENIRAWEEHPNHPQTK